MSNKKLLNRLWKIDSLEAKLYNWIVTENYLSNNDLQCFLEITSIELSYNEAELSEFVINVNWGRYAKVPEMEKFNEQFQTKLIIERNYLDKDDYILGKFAEAITNKSLS